MDDIELVEISSEKSDEDAKEIMSNISVIAFFIRTS